MSDKKKDKDKVLDICRRIERALQRDWGSTGTGLSQRLRTARYVVPPELLKRIHYLRRLQKQALHKQGFRLKSASDFEAKGEQVLEELAQARKTAARRLRPVLEELLARYRVMIGTAVVALLVAAVGGVYLLQEPEPVLPPVAVSTPAPRPAPKPVPKSAPKPAPVAAPAPAPTTPQAEAAPAVAAASAAVIEPAVATTPALLPAGVKVHIDAPAQLRLDLKRAEVAQGASGRDEIVVIVDVQNIGYDSLARITFDAALYDTRGGRPMAVIAPTAPDAVPWHAFMRQALRRGQGAEVRLNYSASSPWAAEQAVALVNSGRYQIHLKAVSLADGDNRSLPL
ncbi:MAG: hypothetical protein O9318_00455 [Hylemonella sp.]|uniref:hypothetical protein n=1 Tax=Hylemonella sp. TaxID=2066020 RepID=UPI0022C79B15|nr:hypothetical protein [Hylemonella sp.]MCZ8250918.1 hypothetical protein [Hylemonella sp.]